MGASPPTPPPGANVSKKPQTQVGLSTGRLSLDSEIWLAQSQNYFTTGGLPPISSSWHQALETHNQYFFSTEHLCNVLSDDRMGLSFTIAAGTRQRSHSQVRVLWDLWPYFTVSDLRLPQPGWSGPSIHIPQEQGGLIIHPGTGFPFCHLLWLTRLWWMYWNPPPHRVHWLAHVSILQIHPLHGPNRKPCSFVDVGDVVSRVPL
jgi:hypothetical protein